MFCLFKNSKQDRFRWYTTRNNVDFDICSLAFDHVKYSAIDSKLLGYNTNVIYNMTRSVNPDNDQEILLLKNLNIFIHKCFFKFLY